MKEYVVAIDLGTSCTAYSWKSLADPTPSVGVPDIQAGEEIFGKSPTSLLVVGNMRADRDFKALCVESYGRQAEENYATNAHPSGSQLFKRFKMEMHKNPLTTNLDDLLGASTKSASKLAEIGLREIVVLALSYIKDAVLKTLSLTKRLTARDVVWVLTVPVCCSNPAKEFMRRSAIEAGFIDGGEDDESLVLCMEPIAACLALGKRLSWETGDKYMVVDCGGGTVDISAFTVNIKPGELTQLGEAGGGPWGATNVDKLFEQFLVDFIYTIAQNVGARVMKSFLASSAMYRITQNWERAKLSLKTVTDECWIDLSELRTSMLEVTMEDMDNGRHEKNRAGEDLVSGFGTWDLILRPNLMNLFFKPFCDSIAEEVTQELEKPELQDLTSVVMVGGFSGSVHLQEAIKTCVRTKYPEGNVNINIATSPDLAVVQGAAHFAHLQDYAPKQRKGLWPGLRPATPPLSAPELPPAPAFREITASVSYGVLTSDVTNASGPSNFDAFILKGKGYEMYYKVNKKYFVNADDPFKIVIGSCTSPAIEEGRNVLTTIGGLEAVQKSQDWSVSVPTVPLQRGVFRKLFCCTNPQSIGGGTNPPGAPPYGDVQDKVQVCVEFVVRGIELHVRVLSATGAVLVNQGVRFQGY